MDVGGGMSQMPPSTQPDMGNYPTMNEPMPDGGGNPNMDMGGFQEPDSGDDMMMNGGNGEDESNPKNEIQKITGELSQKLNDYVSKNQDDSETSKYVLSMIAKQASKNMSDDDKKDVIRKIKSKSDDDDDMMSMDESRDIRETFTSALTKSDDKMDKPFKKVNMFNKVSPFFSNR